MKALIFDTGPIISLASNSLLWLLRPLKKEFNGRFFITSAVKTELVDRPLEIKRFKFEAIQVQKLIDDKILEIADSGSIRETSASLLKTANEIFEAHGYCMRIVHLAEMSVIAAALDMNSDAIVIDEKTTRFLIENPKIIFEILRKTLHTPISINESNLKQFKNEVDGLRVIRSVELAAIAFEHGFLDEYLTKIPDAKKSLLESVLWGVKLNGCAVSGEEIDKIVAMEAK